MSVQKIFFFLFTACLSALGLISSTALLPSQATVAPQAEQARIPHAISRPKIDTIWVGGNSLLVLNPDTINGAVLRLRDGQGVLKAEHTIPYNQDEWIYLYTEDEIPVPILPGDRLEVDYQGEVDQITVPVLSANLDLEFRQVSGSAPPNASLRIQILFGTGNLVLDEFEIASNSTGEYTLNIPEDVNIRKGDKAHVDLLGLPELYRTAAVLPSISAVLYSNNIMGFLPPLSAYTFTMEVGETGCGETGYAGSDGNFSVICPYLPSIIPGKHLSLTTTDQVIEIDIPSLNAYLDRDTGKVTGQAPNNSKLRIYMVDRDFQDHYLGNIDVTASATGEFSADFSSLLPFLNPLGQLVHFDQNENRSLLLFSYPRWFITLGNQCVGGIASAAGIVTIELQEAAGSYTEVVTKLISDALHPHFSACFQHRVNSGHQLTLFEVGNTTNYHVPQLTASYQYDPPALIGQAPPGATLTAYFWPIDDQTISRQSYADLFGNYRIDTSDLSFPPRVYITLVLDEPDGTVELKYLMWQNPSFLPVINRH